jgi:hypothetical protein
MAAGRWQGNVAAKLPPVRIFSRRASLAGVFALLLFTSACGDDARVTFEPPSGGGDERRAQHIHGLGINPADGALMIATHSGLFRAAEGEQAARPVGDRRQDTMGFTVVGPNRFLGSGHPDLRDDLPPLLGLIRSDDGGRGWTPISLLGKADFHVLRSAGERVYGVNATDGKLLVSDDRGKSWATRTPPSVLFDVAVAPGDSARLVASSESGVFVSQDTGKSWRPLDRDRAGLLAWPEADALYLVDGQGGIHRSSDGGATWRTRGALGGQPAAFVSHERDLIAAVHTNEVKLSSDGGRTWRTRVRP